MTTEQQDQDMTAGAGGTQDSAPTDAKQEQSNAANATLREQMFGSKASKPAAPEGEAKEPGKAEETPPEQGQDSGQAQHKKTARETVQEAKRNAKEAKEEAERLRKEASEKSRELEQLKAELEGLRGKKEENKSPRDQYRQIILEEKINERQRQAMGEINAYIQKHEKPEEFIDSYDYYVPIFQQRDGWTLEQISQYPEKLQMLDVFFEAMTNGVFTPDEWIKAPNPMKLRKIQEIRSIAAGRHIKQEPGKAIEDSITPDLKKNPGQAVQDNSKGAAFRKAFYNK